jgi:osmoprotectant transport system permease protein
MELLTDIWAYVSNPASWQGRFALHNLAWQHVWLSAASTLIAAALALPLGLWVGHRGRGELPVVLTTNMGRAIPDFGIIILMLLWLGLGNGPVLVTLAALAVPPILINAYVGVRQVPDDARDAARGAGMTGWQVLSRVEVPVAIPLIMTGVRTAAVQVVATATLAAYIGGGGFGRLIFDGLAIGVARGRDRIILGALLVALLALATEFGLARLERALTPRGIRRELEDQTLVPNMKGSTS